MPYHALAKLNLGDDADSMVPSQLQPSMTANAASSDAFYRGDAYASMSSASQALGSVRSRGQQSDSAFDKTEMKTQTSASNPYEASSVATATQSWAPVDARRRTAGPAINFTGYDPMGRPHNQQWYPSSSEQGSTRGSAIAAPVATRVPEARQSNSKWAKPVSETHNLYYQSCVLYLIYHATRLALDSLLLKRLSHSLRSTTLGKSMTARTVSDSLALQSEC